MITNDDVPVAPAEHPASTPIEAVPKARRKVKAKPPEAEAAKPAKAKPAAKAKAAVMGKTKAKAPVKAKRNRDPAKLDEYGYRKGSIRSKAAHLYASKKGATLAEVKAKLGTVTQYNVLTELQKRGFELRRKAERNRDGRDVTRFFISAAN